MRKLIAILSLLPVFSTFLTGQTDTAQLIFSWKLDDSFAAKIPVPIDTNLNDFQLENSLYRHFISATTLGNTSLPSLSNVFTDRSLNDEFLQLNAFYPFMKRIANTAYMNTTRPFTKLIYINGGSSSTKEEMLDVYHTRNISPVLNFGIHFTTRGAMGQYLLQRIKNNSFRLFSSRTGNIYSYHACFNINRITANENGGILYDSVITGKTYSKTKYIETLFGGMDQTNKNDPDVSRTIRNISLFTSQEIAFRKRNSSTDSVKPEKKFVWFYPKLAYVFILDRSKVLYTDENPEVGYNAGLYPAINGSMVETADSLFHWKMNNMCRLQFQGRKNNHYFVGLTHELLYYSQSLKLDTSLFSSPSLSRESQLFNTYLSSGFEKVFANTLKIDLSGRYYLSGYQSGDYQMAGDIEIMLHGEKNTFSLKAGASNELMKPGYLYEQYVSNHYSWLNMSLKQTLISHLSCDISLSSKGFGAEADYYLFHNLVFFDTAAFPKQYEKGLSVLSVAAGKDFTLWKLHSNNKIVFQQVSDPDILSLPALALRSSNYLEHEFFFRATEGRLLMMIGFDMFYNTSYYANAYMPPLATFYQQEEKKLGNYPYFDVFLNLKLKRARFFIKYEHINSEWLDKNFFTTLHYPMNQQFLKLGISWTFYD